MAPLTCNSDRYSGPGSRTAIHRSNKAGKSLNVFTPKSRTAGGNDSVSKSGATIFAARNNSLKNREVATSPTWEQSAPGNSTPKLGQTQMFHPMMHATDTGVFHGQGVWTYRKDNKRAEAGTMNINNILGAAIGDPIKQQT